MSTTTVTVQGVDVPAIGFGTWRLRGEAAVDAVRDALEIGYRHIDTAVMYDNEAEVGTALGAADVDRDEVFVVTKLQPSDLTPERVARQVPDSLRALGTYIDLLLIHWPNPNVPLGASLEAMASFRDCGDVRHLGVSNFDVGLLAEARRHAPILADQVEFHPWSREDDLVAYGAQHDVMITAYSPLAKGRVEREPVLEEIADAHGATPTQVTLAWLLDKPKVTVIPKAADPRHRRDNLAAGEVELTPGEIARIEALT